MNDEDKVTMLLATAGLSPQGEELAFFVNTYPIVRMMADMLFSVEAANEESPGLVFDPAPRF